MSITRELIDAARGGRLKQVEELVKLIKKDEKATVDLKDQDSKTALFHAAWHNQRDIVKYLHEQKADLSIQDYREVTPLMAAADYGHVDTVVYLLEQKVDVDHVDYRKKTALISAAESSNTSDDRHLICAQLLLKANAKIDHQDKNGNTAIMLAKNPKIFDFLLDEKANIELKNNKGQNLFLKLCNSESPKESLGRLEKLFEKHPDIDVNVLDKEGNSAIDLILKNPTNEKFAIAIIKLLIAKKINSTLITKPFRADLSKDKLKLLTDAGCEPTFTSRLDALNYGYVTDSFDKYYASAITEEKNFKQAEEKEGFLKLFLKAIEDNKFDVACKLTKFIDPNAKNIKGASLLEVALNLNQIPLAEALITAGADKEQVNETGKSLLMRLIPSSRSASNALFLIQKGADLSLVDKNGDTPLIIAVINHYPKLVAAILERYSANINHKNKDDKTALFIAGFDFMDSQPRKCNEVILLLLQANADRTISCPGFWREATTFNQLVELFNSLKHIVKKHDEQEQAKKGGVTAIAKRLRISLTPASSESVELKSSPSEEESKNTAVAHAVKETIFEQAASTTRKP